MKNVKIMDSLARQELDGHIVSTEGVILKMRFWSERKNAYMTICHTESTGKGILDAIDTVKNDSTGEMMTFTRKELRDLTRKIE